jgi:preprotein translocase subunit SecG
MLVLFTILFVIVCLLLIFMVVITPSQSEGLAGAFGGMGSDTFFGTKAGQHINRFTVGLAVSFLVLAILINLYATTRTSQRAPLVQPRSSGQAPAPPPPPANP